jgi:hypothetical protein
MAGQNALRDLWVVAALGLGATQAWAGQQGQAFPPVEVGVQVAGVGRAEGNSGVMPGLNVSWNLDRLTAIDFATDFQPSRTQQYGTYSSRSFAQTLFLVQLRRTFVEFGDTRMFGLVGAGAGSREESYGPYTNGSYSAPGYTYHEGIGAFSIGIGVERRLASRLALRAETTFIISNVSADLRAGIGLSVPIGRFPKAPAQALITPAGFDLVHTGQKVWVTTSDGEVRMGDVAALSANSVTLRHRDGQTQLAAADVRRIDGVDSIKDGALIGAGVGAGVGGLSVGLLVLAADGSGGEALGAGLAFAGVGAGMGALIGAISDSLHEGRRVLYTGDRKKTITVAPIVSAKGAGVGATITWR